MSGIKGKSGVYKRITGEKYGGFKKGYTPWNKGDIGLRKHSVETRLKLSNAHKGSRSHFWKGGLTPINLRIRLSVEYRLWRQSVLTRDGFMCVWCGSNKMLEADHIKPFAYFPELRFAIDNGRTLCKPCHLTTETWGNRNYKFKIATK